ncbi:prepilin-type N-terminal cleavage/methylation domain-containing protein [Patescibacteria group bacterium]|nr:prepilin-type N-terminal cleavage/methylation domain-containing protein [Patescibacteria group bacterium]MBU1501101.1 prepilin-type N-terminal cleavage/methylation domain-containing protein [Patescibacteria group bacterium]MBU2081026.1 prepilin-type N-terminal cleavage/methylation domain-containing protein [Patescibacteria group bacterium]MBU2124117.1 prepilin-type N-terminal cleavage/methylation domain-containing protein [Patescibacteria group bacterium]MBU2194973.1 prepilin-type N-terminal
MPKRGFTLIELLVVIAIIGILSSVVLASLNTAREKAKVANAVSQLRQFRNVVALYFTDTGQYPAGCGLSCTASTDPYLNALGVPGWNGPYFAGGVWNLEHPWGGHFTIDSADLTGDGQPEMYFFLDEDAPGTNSSDNTGIIPLSALLAIDKTLDDGDLATGNLRGNGLGFTSAVGELVYAPQF